MVELCECTRCKEPFVADDGVIAARHGFCLECAKAAILRAWGLREDFLTSYPFG